MVNIYGDGYIAVGHSESVAFERARTGGVEILLADFRGGGAVRELQLHDIAVAAVGCAVADEALEIDGDVATVVDGGIGIVVDEAPIPHDAVWQCRLNGHVLARTDGVCPLALSVGQVGGGGEIAVGDGRL